MQIDVDQIEGWAPALGRKLADLLPPDLEKVRTARPEFYSDARELLFGPDVIEKAASRCAEWIRSRSVVAYHGTRLDQAEQASILQRGLIRLDAAARIELLRERLSRHPNWAEVENQLEPLIERMSGENGLGGSREGQVHLCFSRTNLLRGSNHYSVEGSEFDGHVARTLLGMDGQKLLQAEREPVLIKVILAGSDALEAANPWGCPRPLPNLIREMLDLWSYHQFDESHRPSEGVDCGLMFKRDLPPEWIAELELIDEADLLQHYRAPMS